jgi:hypothetical protein
MSVFILHADSVTRDGVMRRLLAFISELPNEKAFQVQIEPYKRKRSTQQNAYLWGVCYPTILREGGEALRGWDSEDLHRYFLIDHFGSEVIEGFGTKRHKPLRTSSKLSTTEFSDFVAHIQRKTSELGIYIPDPGQEL